MMKNIEIRNQLKETKIKHWQLAEKLGIADTTLCRKLRKELPEREKESILNAIEELNKEI